LRASRPRGGDELEGAAVVEGEGGAQGVMALDEGVQGLL
jgi:hypothetical protein